MRERVWDNEGSRMSGSGMGVKEASESHAGVC